MSDSRSPQSGIPETFLVRLREDICARRLQSGFHWLESHRHVFEDLYPGRKNAAVFIGYLALWVDLGFADIRVIRGLLHRFPESVRPQLTVPEYMHLRLAEGVTAMMEENFHAAVAHLETVLSFANELHDRELTAIACFLIGRCQRRSGRYESALTYTLRGKQLAIELQHPKMAAVIQVLESWLVFQSGKPQDAVRILKQAEAALIETDDFVARGNIQSAYGRIARRQGKYHHSIQRFANAIEEYKKRDLQHKNLARSLANIAFVKRLLALQLRKNIDKAVELRARAGDAGSPAPQSSTLQQRVRYEKLHQEALAQLAEAAEIYTRRNDHRGMGTVHINRGFIHLDNGDLDRAALEAAEAYKLGEDRRDFLLMARVRVLQSILENAKHEEQIEEKSDPGQHAHLAVEFAREALEYAGQTQNRRLLSKAYIAQGLALANDPYGDLERARECADQGGALLGLEGRDYVWEELQLLKAKLLHGGDVETILREWSQGIVGNKSFQQITEEFSAMVIPKVWKREGCKISRVAERLSISPKKVRRILSRQRLLNGKGTDNP